MLRFCFVISLLGCFAVQAQNLPHPLTHVEACRKLSHAIIQVNTERVRGTGFVIDPGGWIATASHLVIDPDTKSKYKSITVRLWTGEIVPAEVVSPVTDLLVLRDFAILKIEKSNLAFAELGDEDDVDIGSNLTIIGFPLSAMFRYTPNPIPRFCLTGTLAANATFQIDNQGHRLDTVYFQGVSIKGISGSPIISLDTGKVIGIVSTRLTGINKGLANLRDEIAAQGESLKLGSFRPIKIEGMIVDVLDEQLANGLGSGTGAADAVYALKQAKRDYERQHPKK